MSRAQPEHTLSPRAAGRPTAAAPAAVAVGAALLWQVLPLDGVPRSVGIWLALTGGALLVASAQFHELAHTAAAARLRLSMAGRPFLSPASPTTIGTAVRPPNAEFWAAAAGPIASVALGGAYALLALALGALLTPTTPSASRVAAALEALLGWVAAFSLALGAANLLPAFPLDGGQMLRALLRGRDGSIFDATVAVAYVGEALALLASVAGGALVLDMFDGGRSAGAPGVLALLVIGGLLHLSAGRAYDQTRAEQSMSAVQVTCVARRALAPVVADTTIERFTSDHMLALDGSVVPVLQQNVLVGVVGLYDLRRAVGMDWARTPIRSIMRPVARTVRAGPTVSLLTAWAALESGDAHQIVVVEHGRIVGILDRQAIVAWLAAHDF